MMMILMITINDNKNAAIFDTFIVHIYTSTSSWHQ